MFVLSLLNQEAYKGNLLSTKNEFRGNGRGWANGLPIDEICNNGHQYLKDNTLTLGLKVIH